MNKTSWLFHFHKSNQMKQYKCLANQYRWSVSVDLLIYQLTDQQKIICNSFNHWWVILLNFLSKMWNINKFQLLKGEKLFVVFVTNNKLKIFRFGWIKSEIWKKMSVLHSKCQNYLKHLNSNWPSCFLCFMLMYSNIKTFLPTSSQRKQEGQFELKCFR